MDRVRGGEGRMLWLDYLDYAAALLAGRQAPWLDTTVCAAWLRKAQSLLGSDVIAVPLGQVCNAWLDAHPPLRAAMALKTRTVFPLKALLADEALRAHLIDLVRALRGTLSAPAFVLASPSPRAWAVEAHRYAHAIDVEVGEDEADSAALYVADFLRAFAAAGVDGLLLVETSATETTSASELACYRSVLNVAAHYRWGCGLLMPAGRYVGGEAGFDFVIAPRLLPGSACGLVLGEDFWSGAPPPDPVPGAFRFLKVPVHCDPELVLERRTSLR